VWAILVVIEDERWITERASFGLFVVEYASLWCDVLATCGTK